MRLNDDLLMSLMTGLPDDDQGELLKSLQRARDEQLNRKLEPPRRRRRGSDGVLRMPDEAA